MNRKRTLGRLLTAGALLGAALLLAAPASAEPTLSLSGCKLDDFISQAKALGDTDPALDEYAYLCDGYLDPPASPLTASQIKSRGGYTTGNLGPGWNEFDLVPHRIVSDNSGASAVQEDFLFDLAGDSEITKNSIPLPYLGYDVMSEPVLNLELSSAAGDVTAACSFSVGIQQTISGTVGGVDTIITRQMDISQAAGSICVWDYVQRLAISAPPDCRLEPL